MSVEVLNAGFVTTIQDRGRQGFAAEGWRACGACDAWAARMANLMAGNGPWAAVVETTAWGLTLRFQEACVTAFSGLSVQGTLRGQDVPMNQPLLAEAGDVLELRILQGVRAYVAVRGGILVPEVLGSRATDLACGIGGLEGRRLKAGDVLPIGPQSPEGFPKLQRRAAMLRRILKMEHPAAGEDACVRVLPGPDIGLFPEEARRAFVSAPYRVGADSNRMGLRLEGQGVIPADGKMDVLSGAVVSGSVQIAASGQPIVMLCDHQTTGGYAQLAVVSPLDLPILAQVKPGGQVRFQWADPSDQLRAYRKQERAWRFGTRLMNGKETA